MMNRLLSKQPNLPSIIVRNYAKQAKHAADRPQAQYKQYLRRRFEEPVHVLESTPTLFEHTSLSNREMFKQLNIDDISVRPAIPVQLVDFKTKKMSREDRKRKFVDPTKLKNQEWVKTQRPKLIQAFANLDLHVDLYPTRVEKTEFQHEFINGININLKVSYEAPKVESKKDVKITQVCVNEEIFKMVNVAEENLFRSNALMGNFLEAEIVKQKPTVEYEVDNQNDFYTLVMLTPDYPYRLVPDQGNFINWMVVNIPGNQVGKGDEICSYLPPLPTEYAGTFRYVFMLFKQSDKKAPEQVISLLKSKGFEKAQPAEQLKQDTKRVQDQRENMRKYANEYEHEYIEQLLEERFNFGSNYVDSEKYPIQHSDYRPPKPTKAITDPIELSKRRKFDLEKFVGEKLPLGACFFRTEYDLCVSQEYEKHGWEEPFYVPPDLMHENMLKEHKVYLGKKLRANKAASAQWN